ncbi:Heat shock 70 kDa protein 12A [Stylophora pistillata]|uniref:Heat shock 70 kDa protein 12A n=1 Tax=Stylophora pistillata TaxID=50429 RepID=A0A2B4RSI7_STYPI|nr:Heat shock 70 kDa protein 12A [Stylophora pistillata]
MNDFEIKKWGRRIVEQQATTIRLPCSFFDLINDDVKMTLKRHADGEIKIRNNENLCLNSIVMRKLFQPVLGAIKAHLKALLDEPRLSKVTVMLLVGEFANSLLLQEGFKKEFSSRCNVVYPCLTPPATGWDAPPASTDHCLEADLARVKYYRNSVYGHVRQNMEIKDDSQFLFLWREISETLVRIAGQIHPSKKHDWQVAINKFLKDPLTTEDERYVQELLDWYRRDLEVKKYVEELQETTLHITEQLQRVAEGETPVNQAIKEKWKTLGKQLGT